MCAIVGALLWNLTTPARLKAANQILGHIIEQSHERGRDGRGYILNSSAELELLEYRETYRRTGDDYEHMKAITNQCGRAVFLCNLRAEPTTEFVRDKKFTDQQPYTSGAWTIVHNGTIANDKELRTGELPTSIDSAAIAEVLGQDPNIDAFEHFVEAVHRLRGSYAILANRLQRPDQIHVAANYRPIWYAVTDNGVFFASARHYFPDDLVPQMVEPYTAMSFTAAGEGLQVRTRSLRAALGRDRALVVCSGGLDSVVAATVAKRQLGMEVELIHFQYGSRAEGPEVVAVQAVAEALGVPCTLFPLPVYAKSDSPLLDADSPVAGGEEGAEFAHEWVPARNLLLLSVATAYAEAKGFNVIVLGNNLEEAGAYPDNEPEFIARFNDLLPFAVGDGKRMRVIMPVGNLMKHEIVALGVELGAPLHLTWSCYRAGEKHCGKCGPCYMRRTAFEINNIPEVITYEDKQ